MGKLFEPVRTNKLFYEALQAVYEGPDAEVYFKAPIHLEARSMPEAEVSVVTLDAARETRTPKAGEIHLVVEIAQTSQAKDFGQRRAMYARAGIPGMWIVDVPGRLLDIYTKPEPETGRYDGHLIVSADEDVPGVGRPLRELLP